MKQDKRVWHDVMRPRACAFAVGKCQRCGKSAEGFQGVIHHLKYPEGCYGRPVEDLIRERICEWLCRQCHEAIHITDEWADAQDQKKSGGHCKICGKLAFGVWDRAKTLGIEYPICKRCLSQQRHEDKINKSGQLKFF